MNISLDISQIAYQGTGVARFAHGLIKTILSNGSAHNWSFFFSSLRQKLDDDIKKEILNKGYRVYEYKIPPTLLAFLWNDLHILKVNHFVGQSDWFVTSDWTEPPSRIKKATIIHDLVYLRYPETVTNVIRKTQRQRLSWVKKESAVIFADSDSTKNDLVDLLKINNQRITTNYPGINIIESNQQQVGSTLKKFKLLKPFILTVGKLEPRKNLQRLLEAYIKLKPKNIDLVIVGQQGWDNSIHRHIGVNKDGVHLLGYVDDVELMALYSACLFFIYPSLYEGFGYPVLEAMKIGTAVATSNTSSLKEIADNAALLFNPLVVKDIKLAMEKLINDEGLKAELIKKGKQRAANFTWNNYYNKFINTLENN